MIEELLLIGQQTSSRKMIRLVQSEFKVAANVPIVFFPTDSSDIQDSPRLTIVVADPDMDWSGSGPTRQQVSEWIKVRGKISQTLSRRHRVVYQETWSRLPRKG